MKCKRAIIGVGNVLLSDEGVGVHAVRYMQKWSNIPDRVKVIDGGTEGFGLMDLMVDCDRVVIIDCVKGGCRPGTIYCFDVDEIENSPFEYNSSIHQVGIVDIVKMVELIATPPFATIVGIEPACIDMGLELSDVVKKVVPRVAELSLQVVKMDSKQEVKDFRGKLRKEA